MKRIAGLGLGLLITALSACTFGTGDLEVPPADTEGGANSHDRTILGGTGEPLLTGVMEIAPSGNYAIMQRNVVTVLLDVQTQVYVELPAQLARVVISKKRDVAYVVYKNGTMAALDLKAMGVELWSAPMPYNDISLFRINDEDNALLVVNGSEAISIDPTTGKERGRAALSSSASHGAFMPGGAKALVVGHTVFTDHKPLTPVTLVDLMKPAASEISVPNCEAPISVLPDGSRALLSPTFCQEDRPEGTPQDAWTNPDPVSIIDINAGEMSFLKNLPGFGPVALSPDGSRAVAYLDMARIDKTMFDDKAQIPDEKGPQYHLMTIEPKSLKFELHPVGNGLPRFAMSRDGKGLLVDASVQIVTRVSFQASANVKVKIGADGVSTDAKASISLFGSDAAFGYFDLVSGEFTGFTGAKAGLDRFVQLGDNRTVITLEKRTDGLGGIPYKIDLATKSVWPIIGDHGTGVRDIGVLPDGVSLILRYRRPAVQIDLGLYARESYCYSFDATVCAGGSVEYQSSVPFATLPDPNVPPPPDQPPAPPPAVDDLCPDPDCL